MNNLFDNLQFKVYTDILKKSKKDGKRLIRGYASTAALDRQNEVITIEALRQAADHLLENHTVFYEHEHQKFPVGKVIETGIDDKGLKVVVEISQTADQLWTLIEEDILDSFSIGGRVIASEEKVGKDGKRYNEVTGIELFEVSVVGLPANPEAKFALVNKSFNTAITDEIKKREEGKEMAEEKKIETTDSDTTDITVSDGTSDVVETTEPKAEEKKAEEVVEEKKEEPTKVEKKEDSRVEEKEDAQKKDLEKYEKEDEEAAEKIKSEEKVEDTKAEAAPTTSDDTSTIQINLLPDKTGETVSEAKEEKSEPVEEKKEEPKVEEKKEEEVKDDDEATWELLIDEVEDAKQYPYPYYPYPYAKLGEEVKEIIFLLDKLLAKETNEDVKALLQEIKAKVSKLVGQEYPYPEKYPYPKKEEEAGKQYPAPEAPLKEILASLKDLGKKIDEVLSRLPEKAVEESKVEEKAPEVGQGQGQGNPRQGVGGRSTCYCLKCDKEVEHKRGTPCIEQVCPDCGEKLLAEKPKAKEKKEEPKIEKKVEKTKEKVKKEPQRKSFIADAPYADKKNDEEKRDVKKTTDRGWNRIVFGK